MHNDKGSENVQYYLKQKGIRDASCTVDIIACSNGHGTSRHGGGTSRGGEAILWIGLGWKSLDAPILRALMVLIKCLRLLNIKQYSVQSYLAVHSDRNMHEY